MTFEGSVEMSGEETDPFKSLHNIIVYSPSDFSKTIEMAWIYGIVVGWDDECFEEFEQCSILSTLVKTLLSPFILVYFSVQHRKWLSISDIRIIGV